MFLRLPVLYFPTTIQKGRQIKRRKTAFAEMVVSSSKIQKPLLGIRSEMRKPAICG